ncbi:MAG: hypothetical protein ACYDA7_05230 [Acidithiobacillus sp.]
MDDRNCFVYKTVSTRERLFAIGTLLLETALLVIVVILVLTALGFASEWITHSIFGYSSWGVMQSFGWLLFWAIVAAPIILVSKVVWRIQRDEYQRILRARMRKW